MSSSSSEEEYSSSSSVHDGGFGSDKMIKLAYMLGKSNQLNHTFQASQDKNDFYALLRKSGKPKKVKKIKKVKKVKKVKQEERKRKRK